MAAVVVPITAELTGNAGLIDAGIALTLPFGFFALGVVFVVSAGIIDALRLGGSRWVEAVPVVVVSVGTYGALAWANVVTARELRRSLCRRTGPA